MASKRELESMFNDLRTDLGAMIDERVVQITTRFDGLAKPAKPEEAATRKASIDKECADLRQLWRFAQMGIFVLENVVIDLKRIADASEASNVEIVATLDPDQLTIHQA